MSDEQTFAEFITRIRNGDERAAAELVLQYEPLIRREVRVQLNDRRLIQLLDSTDICQSVLATFFVRTAAGEYDISTAVQLVGLLVSIARNKLISAARREHSLRRDARRRVRPEAQDLQQIPDPRQEPVEEVANRELLKQIYEHLSAEELQISRLRSSGAAWEEVASAMGGTPQSRRMQFTRALDRIARQFDLA